MHHSDSQMQRTLGMLVQHVHFASFIHNIATANDSLLLLTMDGQANRKLTKV